MTDTDLFDPVVLNGLSLSNRIAMSPLTRARAASDGTPGELQATYYGQRASAGLLITEATAVVPEGRGGAFIPGLWDDKHVDGWRLTTEAVHASGGKIFCQLWHAGRLSHSSLDLQGRAPAAPSVMRQEGQVFTESGMQPYDEARALTLAEIAELIDAYRAAAERAKAAGFDGVELHAAHSYLIDAFMRDMTNKRDDEYGGSIENRTRLMAEVTAELVAVFGGERVMVRFSPIGHAYSAWDSDPEPLFTRAVERLNEAGVGWLDLVEGDTGITREIEPSFDLTKLRGLFKGVLVANNLYSLDMAIEARREDRADMVAFGVPFIANPDLVERFKAGAALNTARRSAYYGGGAKGYTDFPTMAEAVPA